MRSALRTISLAVALLAVLFGAASRAASDTVIKGIVTDAAGKPVRGATVKATVGVKSISRFSQADGRYEIAVPAGKYDVSAFAYGFATKKQVKDTAQAGEVNFNLTPRFDVASLSGAQVEQLIPSDAEGKFLKESCNGCHDLATVARKAGMAASQWKAFIPVMTAGRRDQPRFTNNQLEFLGNALGKYFGPDSPYFGANAELPTKTQVKTPEVADPVLKATILEWTTPTGADGFPHSIEVDSKRGTAWYSLVGNRGMDWAKCDLFQPDNPEPAGASCGENKVGRFDIATEKFTEIVVPHPHTGSVGLDGRVWYALAMRSTTAPDLAVVDPATNKVRYFKMKDYAARGFAAHTPIISKITGNVWLSGGKGEIVEFDVKKEEFKIHKFPVPAQWPKDAPATWMHVAGDPEPKPRGSTYHVGEDSKGMIWASIYDFAMLVKLDPSTSETKEYFPPIHNSRGLVIDNQDNVWFSAYQDHKIGKLDPRTGEMKIFNPPTPGASPYGLTFDKKTGTVWYGDQVGDNITQFDPKTEKFVEYPLPNNTHPTTPRFIWAADDGKIWFTEYWIGRIGYVDPTGGSKPAAAQ